MLRRKKLRGIAAVMLSYGSLWMVSAMLSAMSFLNAHISGMLSYIGGFFASALVMKLCARYLQDESAEDEIVTGDVPPSSEKEKSEWRSICIKAIVTACLLVIVNFLYAAAIGNTDVPNEENFLIKAVTGVVIKPAAEEYLFRVLYLRALIICGIKPHISVVIQAVLFALMHEAAAMPFAILAGILLGSLAQYAGEKHGFKAAYISHAAYNGTLYLILAMIK